MGFGTPPDVARRYLEAFRAEAGRLFETPEAVSPPIPRRYKCSAALLERPALDNHIARYVYTARDEPTVLVRRISYDETTTMRQIDGRMTFLTSAIPPIVCHVEDRPSVGIRWMPIWKRLRGVRINAVAPEAERVGLDGVTYTLSSGSLFGGRTTLTWWCDGPADWLELIGAVQVFSDWVDTEIATPRSGIGDSHNTLS